MVRIRLDQPSGKLLAEWFDVDGGGVAASRERACGSCRDSQLQQAAAALGSELLREAHPEAEPTEVEPLVMDLWLERLGVDVSDDELVSQTVVAWERLMV